MPDNSVILAPRFHSLFAGLERAHGSYQNINWDQARQDGKFKGDAVTKREPVTDDLWAQHLDGKYGGIGIIPIRDDSMCVFGAIDVDVYEGLDLARVASTVANMGLPLVPCRSKSGGVHLFCFAKAPVPAANMQKRLQEIAARIGFGSAEIFPKQARMGGDRDLGSWINIPYQNAVETNRYGVMVSGDAMTPEEFLAAAEAAKQPAEWFSQSVPQNPDSPLPDGPPCLQRLMEIGFPPGTWNAGVLNLGIYCKKAYPDNWKEHLVQLNALHFPIDKWPASDLDPIKKSLTRKDYFYQCGKHPLKQYCDRETCRQRAYGVGAANLLPCLSSLTMLLTSPPVWFLDIEGGHRIELTTEELFNPLAFQIKCGNHRVVVPVTGRAAWTEYLRPFIAKANEIPVADDGSGDDSSPRALFLELLEEFCTGRAQGQGLEDVRSKKPYTADGVTIFRLADLMAFVSRKGFKNFQRRDAVVTLKSPGVGGKNWEQSVCGKSTRLWSVPEFTRKDAPVPSDAGPSDAGGF